MIERMVFQILGILSIGDILATRIFFKGELHQSIPRRFINATVMGYASLIIPMTLVGVFLDGHLDKFVMLYYGISMGVTIIQGIRLVLNRSSLTKPSFTKIQNYLFYLNLVIITGYGIMLIIIPERGWDSMNFYLPNAIYFFAENGIFPTLNPFTFYPTFKPPFTTLYITYSFYVGQGMLANLHPFIFIITIVITIYQFCIDIDLDVTTSLLASTVFLTFQFTGILVAEFAYYQEIPILLFSFGTLYYLNLFAKHRDLSSLTGIILAFSLSILSKMSGYAVIFLILISVKIDEKFQKLQILLISGATIFLFRKAIFDIYIGTGIVVLLVALLLMYTVVTRDTISLRYSDLVKIFIIPLLIGILWIWFMLQVQGIQNFLLNTYIYSKNVLKFSYPAALIPTEVLIEHGPRASFLASALFIIFGSAFGPQFFIFKIHGFIRSIEFSLLHRWTLGYLMLFYAYFSDVSARYMVPAMAPLAIFIAISLSNFLTRHKSKDLQLFILNLFFVSGLFFLFPVLPIRVVRDGFLSLFYLFHLEMIASIAFLMMMIIGMFKLFQYLNNNERINLRSINALMIIILIIPYIVAPIGIVTYGKVTETNTDQLTSYYYRPTFQNMISHLKSQDIDQKEVIISAITPGLAYFMKQTVLDIHLTSGFRAFATDLKEMTIDEAREFVIDLNVKIVIQINNQSLSYDYYSQFYEDVALMQIVKHMDFNETYRNQEFIVFVLQS